MRKTVGGGVVKDLRLALDVGPRVDEAQTVEMRREEFNNEDLVVKLRGCRY